MNIQFLTNPHVFTHLLAFQQLRNRDVVALCFPFPRTWHFSLGTFCSFNCDGYQYETKPQAQGGRGYAELLFFPTAEGYVKTLYKDDLNEQEPADFQYIYIYKDHLGNNRLSYTLDPQTEQVKILEENHYYPFGLKHGSYNNIKKEVKYKEELAEKKEVKQVMADKMAFKYKYNGKELQDELGLNLYSMDMRQYDPAIARWTSVDPVTHHSESTYNAFDNNPVYWADPSGADSIYNWDTGQYVINGQEVSFDTALSYAQNGGNADGSNDNTPREATKPKAHIDYALLDNGQHYFSLVTEKEDVCIRGKKKKVVTTRTIIEVLVTLTKTGTGIVATTIQRKRIETIVKTYKRFGLNPQSGDINWLRTNYYTIPHKPIEISSFNSIGLERYGLDFIEQIKNVVALNRNNYRIDASPMNVPVDMDSHNIGGLLGLAIQGMEYIGGFKMNPQVSAISSGMLSGQWLGATVGNWLRTHNIRKTATLWHN